MGTMLGLLIGILLTGVVSGIVIWLVSSMNLGLRVAGFGSAVVAGLVIGALSGVVNWALAGAGVTLPAGLLGVVVHLVLAALVIYFAGGLLRGLSVDGFTGALVAAVAIAVVYWLVNFAMNAMGMGGA